MPPSFYRQSAPYRGPQAPGSGQPDPDRHPDFYRNVPLKRGVAWLIDVAAAGVLTALIVPFTAFVAMFFLPLLFVAVSFAWRVVGLIRLSATPGMWLMAVELRDLHGHRLDPTQAVLHTLGFFATTAMVLPQVASAALMLTTQRGQGLHDLVLGSVAINRPGRL